VAFGLEPMSRAYCGRSLIKFGLGEGEGGDSAYARTGMGPRFIIYYYYFIYLLRGTKQPPGSSPQKLLIPLEQAARERRLCSPTEPVAGRMCGKRAGMSGLSGTCWKLDAKPKAFIHNQVDRGLAVTGGAHCGIPRGVR
jgi:hypothetical protein